MKMNILKKIFSISNDKTSCHKIVEIFGLKLKFKSKFLTLQKDLSKVKKELIKSKKELIKSIKKLQNESKNFKNEFSKIHSKEYLQIHYTLRLNGVTDELMEKLNSLEQSKYSWISCHKKIWPTYIICLLKLNNKEKAIKILNKYKYFYGEDIIQRYFPVSKFAHENGITNELIEQSAKCYDILEQNKREDILKKLIENKSIALVGNGPCEIGKNKGEEIDSHDIVIRFNNFKIDGYEKDYGKKTDIWSCNLNADIELRNNKFKLILLPETIEARGFYKYEVFHEAIKNNIPIYCFNDEQTYGLTRDMNYNPTFGYRLIYGLNDILGSLDNVDFYGFNFLKEEKDKYTYHYFNDIDFSSEDEIESVHDLLDETEKLIEFINAHRNENV